MENYIGKICPYCKVALAESDDVVVCSQCEMPHHRDCWIENQGCTTFGCNGSIQGVPRAEFDIASNVATPKFNQASSAGTTSAATYYMQPADSQAADIGLHTLYCNHCGTLVGENTKKCPKCGKTVSRKKGGVAWIIISVILLISGVSLGIYEYNVIDGLNATIAKQSTEIQKLEKTVDDYKEKADDYDEIKRACSSGNIGSGSSSFYVSQGIVVMRKNDSQKAISITAAYSGHTTIYSDTSGTSAYVDFKYSSWSGNTTTLLISPIRKGVTTVTFSNSRSSHEFKLIVVVTD